MTDIKAAGLGFLVGVAVGRFAGDAPTAARLTGGRIRAPRTVRFPSVTSLTIADCEFLVEGGSFDVEFEETP